MTAVGTAAVYRNNDSELISLLVHVGWLASCMTVDNVECRASEFFSTREVFITSKCLGENLQAVLEAPFHFLAISFPSYFIS
jgi:hypothetical protein